MAFTIAHMAAALPFYNTKLIKKYWLSFDALLIGTILPDIPYFIARLFPPQFNAHFLHHWSNIFHYGLFYGFVLWLSWVFWIKPAVVALIISCLKLDFNFQHKNIKTHCASDKGKLYIALFHNFENNNLLSPKLSLKIIYLLKYYLLIIVAILLGAATHLIWDSATHINGWIVRHVTWLQQAVDLGLIGTMSTSRFLQYLSSLFGLLVLLIFIYKYLINLKANQHKSIINDKFSIKYFVPLLIPNRFISMVVISAIILGSIAYGLYSVRSWPVPIGRDPYVWLTTLLISSLQIAILLVCLYASLYQIFRVLLYSKGETS